MTKHTSWILWVFLFLTSSVQAGQALVVYTVNYPLQYFAQRIGGDQVEVHFPASADVDPAFWMPDAEDLAAYQAADLILLNGAGYARWVKKVSLPRRKLVNTSQPFMDKYITTNLGTTHSHGPAGDHSHAGIAFTTWLDFNQALMQAHAILDAFKRLRPGSAIAFEKNYADLQRDLTDLDRRMRALRINHPDLILWASHPVYQYLARRYEIEIPSKMWEPDVAPGKEEITELKHDLKRHPSHWMIWEAQPRQETIQALQKLQLQTLVFNPSANHPVTGDFLGVMQDNISSLEAALQ